MEAIKKFLTCGGPYFNSRLASASLYRGVAQLVAHVVWDHGVGSSSLFTPTKDVIRMVAV